MANLENLKAPQTWRGIADAAFDRYTSDFPDIAKEAVRAELPDMDEQAANEFVKSFTSAHQYPVMRFMLAGGRSTSAARIADGEITDEDVERWVRAGAAGDPLGKQFDERDSDVDDVVRKMQGILIYGAPDSSRAAARATYLPLIAQFSAKEAATGVATKAETAILTAWVKHIRATWPDICRAHLRSAMNN